MIAMTVKLRYSEVRKLPNWISMTPLPESAPSGLQVINMRSQAEALVTHIFRPRRTTSRIALDGYKICFPAGKYLATWTSFENRTRKEGFRLAWRTTLGYACR